MILFCLVLYLAHWVELEGYVMNSPSPMPVAGVFESLLSKNGTRNSKLSYRWQTAWRICANVMAWLTS